MHLFRDLVESSGNLSSSGSGFVGRISLVQLQSSICVVVLRLRSFRFNFGCRMYVGIHLFYISFLSGIQIFRVFLQGPLATVVCGNAPFLSLILLVWVLFLLASTVMFADLFIFSQNQVFVSLIPCLIFHLHFMDFFHIVILLLTYDLAHSCF